MLRFLTAGESHGQALLGIIEGLPAGLGISLPEIAKQMRRRKLGYGRGHRQKIEDDVVEILSGVRHGETLGSPIGLIIHNRDWKNWQDIMSVEPASGEVRRRVHVPRPGHADLVGATKYQHKDMRNVLERSSARETAMRVALGSLARQFLRAGDIHVASRVIRLGPVVDSSELDVAVADLNDELDERALRCLDKKLDKEMTQVVDQAKSKGDTVGGVFEVYIAGLPIGLGSYVQWDRRLEGNLAQALLSMNAVKGFELGMGFKHGEVFGSEAHDEFVLSKNKKHVDYRTNRAGGITGGMSTGQTVVLRSVMKPISTLMKPLASVDLRSMTETKAHVERSDTSAVAACAVICESLVCLVVAEELLRKFGGDSMAEFLPRLRAWNEETR